MVRCGRQVEDLGLVVVGGGGPSLLGQDQIGLGRSVKVGLAGNSQVVRNTI